ncbi:MAG: enoyl-CoA hydratase/isomerase family protein [Proteobacteria bacterium]|nr:enoyl-CoA hydratase/isomerase family protein [Pseudomonadota bacterium]
MLFSLARQGDIAVVTLDNPPVNAISRAVRQGLLDMVEAVERDEGVRAVVLACAGRTFIAGADVKEFGKPPEAPHLPDVIKAIETCSKPWVATIHGAALGGGLEVALGCTARVATASASLGLPEVTLGVIPGAGGTTRLPRLVGVERAVDMITSGKPVKAPAGKAMGLVDEIIEGELLEGAIAFARKLATAPRAVPLSARAVVAPPEAFWTEKRAALAKSAKGEVAPLKALECIKAASEMPFDEASKVEREAFLALRASPEAAALRHVTFAERAAPRPPEMNGIEPRALKALGVIGGGTMGAGIAAAALDAGLSVTLVERDAEALARGLANLKGIVDGAVKRGKLSAEAAEARMAGVAASTDYAALGHVDLVIEAVFEDLSVKRAVFEQAARACRADAILATNTSYLDPEAIFEGVPGAERCLGLHFFSPAQVMKLLEIVPCKATAADVLATGFALARAMNKIPVRAGICDGFIGNRILKTTRAQAERLLLAGATPAEVDAAMRAFGLPMGPFEAQDLGGLDIAAFQRKAARERGETPFAPVADRLVALGRLGQKTRGGWYDYDEGSRTPKASPAVLEAIHLASKEAGITTGAFTPEQIQDAILLPMVNEGAKILAEGIALRAADIDLVKIHGYGFPRTKGGPMHWAKTVGDAARGFAPVHEALTALAARGLAAAPDEALLALR